MYSGEGFGDFIRSLFAIFVFCKENNIEHKLYIPEHPLNKCFDCITEKLDYPLKKFRDYGQKPDNKEILAELNKGKDPNYNIIIYSNIFTFVPIDLLKKYTSEFKSFLKLSDVVKQRIITLKNQINNVEYTAIHIRCGDQFMESGGRCVADNRISPHQDLLFRKLIKIINYLKITYNLPICVFTDTKSLRDKICKEYDLLSFNTTIHHIATQNSNINAYIDTIAEFELLGEAKAIIKLASTGFAYWSAFIHDVPLFICDDITHKIVPFEDLKA